MARKYEQLQVGDRTYYTGDMANPDSRGTITAIRPATNYGGMSYDIRFDEDGKIHVISAVMFEPGSGRRFWPLSEWLDDQERRIKEMEAQLWSMKFSKDLNQGVTNDK